MEEKKNKEVQEAEELSLDELEEVSGGRGLRDVYVTPTHEIGESVRKRS